MSNRMDWTTLVRLPWDMFAGGMDLMCRAALPPGTFERRYNCGDTGGSRGRSTSDWSEGSWRMDDRGIEFENRTETDRQSTHNGHSHNGHHHNGDGGRVDLRGDDIKLVSYKIVFTKRGKERVLDFGEDFVHYSTDTATYAGQKIGRYLMRSGSDIAEEDQRFVKVHIEVLKRFEKEEDDYEDRKIRLLEREVEVLESLDRNFALNNQRRAA